MNVGDSVIVMYPFNASFYKRNGVIFGTGIEPDTFYVSCDRDIIMVDRYWLRKKIIGKPAFEVAYFDVDTYSEISDLSVSLSVDGWEYKSYKRVWTSFNSRVYRVKFIRGKFIKYSHENMVKS